jgi:LysM repeat protein
MAVLSRTLMLGAASAFGLIATACSVTIDPAGTFGSGRQPGHTYASPANGSGVGAAPAHQHHTQPVRQASRAPTWQDKSQSSRSAAGYAPQTNPALITGARSHIVRRGETLFSIATLHRTTVAALARANSLPNANLRVGQRLLLPPSYR